MYPVTRTPEQGHTAACLAKAMIAAIENLRDSAISDARTYNYVTHQWEAQDSMADHEFRLSAQDNTPLAWADLYLSEGMTVCICPVGHAVIRIDGAGSGVCIDCEGQLDYSWVAFRADGTSTTHCSTCVPAVDA